LAPKVEIAKATAADAEALSSTLNPFQMKVILAMGDKTVKECLARSFGGSTASWSGRVDGELVAMWGVYPLQGGCGFPWLYSSPRLAAYPRAALVIGHHAIREMLAIHPRLYGTVNSRFGESVRFARHLGFTIGGYPADPPLLTIERVSP